jgi:hypothetical protein
MARAVINPMKPSHYGLILTAMLALSGASCSKQSSVQRNEASLPELNRALQTWVISRGSYPNEINELTNFPTLRGKQLPQLPPGKRLIIDPNTSQIVVGPE